MKNIPEFYILGEPIETVVGDCEFIKVRDLPDYFQELQLMSMSQDEIIYEYSKMVKKEEVNDVLEHFKNFSSLFELVTRTQQFSESYSKVFFKVFSEDSVPNINKDNFDEIRKLILAMNCQKEEKINPNPEIQRAIERSRRVKSKESEKVTFSDIVTSIVGFNGLTYENINNMTIYQLYMTYYRIAQIKGYETSTLFATVSHDTKGIESWSKHIDLFEEEKHTVSHSKFKKTTGSILE